MYQLLLVSVLLLSTVNSGINVPTFNSEIPRGSLREVGMDSSIINKMTTELQAGNYPNIHSVLVYKDNKLVYERYFPGEDEILGEPIGTVNHSKSTLHDLRSVSKSVVGACIGIAIAQGNIKSEDQPLFDFFPEYTELKTGDKSKLTIKHLLTMTSGFKWNENIPYDNPENYEIRMEQSPDPVRFVLEQELVAEPGKVWNYNGGCTEVLAAIIYKSTGLEVDEFAKQFLFSPLGIYKLEWTKFPTATERKHIPAAASGLRLSSEDMLKFGILYMNEGKWNDKQVLPASWIKKSSYFQTKREDPTKGYGYQFWIENEKVNEKPIHRIIAVGNGGQRISFDHENKLLVVVTAGVYNKWDIINNSDKLLLHFIYPSFLR